MTKRIYNELEGANLLQIFSLVSGKGSKNTLKKCQEADMKMAKEKINHGVKLMKRSIDEVFRNADKQEHLNSEKLLKVQKNSIEQKE